MVADVGDRVFAAERFQRGLLRFGANAIGWVTKETNERDFEFDIFLSYSSRDRDQARSVVRAAAVEPDRHWLANGV
jgi:hypothetical protein